MKALFVGSDTHRSWLAAGLPPECDLVIVSPDDPELLQLMKDADVFLGWGPLTKGMVQAAERLKLVQVIGTGTDWIDLTALAEAGIPVSNTIGANARSVAELVVAFILARYRHLIEADASTRAGQWRQAEFVNRGTFELTGKTVGLVGFGAVGREVARVLTGFDARILYHDPRRASPNEERTLRAAFVALDDLLRESDIVSLHVALTEHTRGLIGARELSLMKRTALLINASRGPVVDEQALTEALVLGRIAGAGIDVYSTEPPPPDHPLLSAPAKVLTPHFGGMTQEAFARHMAIVRENIRRVFDGRELLNPVRSPDGGVL